MLLFIKLIYDQIFRKGKKVFIENECSIYAAHGSFLIFTINYFNKGGYIDDGFFLYGEEYSVAGIVENLKGNIIYSPYLIVFNKGKQTVGVKLTKKKYNYQKDANRYIKNRYSHIYKY